MTIADVPTGEGHAYRLEFAPPARAAWIALDGSIRKVLWPLLAKRLDQPHVPGARLYGNLAGCYKIKLLRQGIRLIYSVEDHRLIVTVIGIGKRENNESYEGAKDVLHDLADRIERGERPPAS